MADDQRTGSTGYPQGLQISLVRFFGGGGDAESASVDSFASTTARAA
jgi:hypothetical protein